VQVAQAEVLCINHDDGVHVGHVDARLNDGGGYQHILFLIDKIGNHLFQLLRIHLSMSHGDAYAGHFTPDHCLQLIDILDTVVHDEDLSVAADLEVHRIADDLHVEGVHLGLYRIAVGRRRTDGGEVACPHQ